MKQLTKDSILKTKSKNIAFLRFNLDTLGENFIYEESKMFKDYSPIIFCGSIKRIEKTLSHYCHRDFSKLYHKHFKWPAFPESLSEIYYTGLSKSLEIMRKHHIKLFHAQFLTDAYFYYPIIKDLGLPLVVSLRGYDLFHPNVKSYLITVMPSVSKFLVKSESMKRELISLGCNEHKIQVIYGGVNTDKIIFKPRLPTKRTIKILSAGRFVEKKGYDVTLKLFKELLKKYPSAELTLIGEGELKTEIISLINQLGIKNNTKVLAYQSHLKFIKELYKHNLFILPSRTAKDGNKEGIPNVLKEAMASGMPVISTYHSGIPELISDSETGYLVEENNQNALLTRIDSILNHQNKSFKLCLNARFFVEKYFNVKNSAKQLEMLYNYLLLPSFVQSSIDLNEGRKPQFFRIDLHLSKGCNSKCIMCGNWKTPIGTSFSRKKVTALFSQLKAFGVDQIRFHGQEPTLMNNIFSIIKEAKSMGFTTGLKTNALIFEDENNIKKLAGSLNDLYLSIDSSKEDIHNKMRGKKQSFSVNLFLFKKLREINPEVNVFFNAVITNINYQHLEGLIDIANTMKANRVSFVHLADKNDDIKNFKLSKSQFKEFYFQIWPRILGKSLTYDIPVSLEPNFISLLNLPISLQISKLKNSQEIFNEEIDNYINGLYGKKFYQKYTCPGVLDHGTIDWEGNVYPCCAMPRPPEFAIGNLHKNSFEEIWNSSEYVKYRENILKGECKFKNQCGRSFKKTMKHNTSLKMQNIQMQDSIQIFQKQLLVNPSVSKYYLEKLLYYAFSKSNIYQKKFENLLNKNWKFNIPDIPLITRDELRTSFPNKDAVPNYFEEDYGVFRTSSCGSEAFMYARPLETDTFNRMTTSFIQTGKWKRGQPWIKLTSINCIESQNPIKISSNQKNIQNRTGVSATVIPASDDFIHEPLLKIKKIYNQIKNTKSFLIHANPSHLKLLLYRFNQEQLKLDNKYAIHSTYELLLPSTKNIIKKYLNCSIFNQYGCSEVGPVYFTCSKGNNHIFSETIHVEISPDKSLNRPDVGRVLVTNLKNYVMPFIKYYTGDFAYILDDTKCSCGLKNPIMGNILGRDTQIIQYKDKAIFPLELDTVFCNIANILMYQVILNNDQLLVKIVPENNSIPVNKEQITNNLKVSFEDNNLQTHIQEVDFISPKRKGKYSTIIIN